MSLLCYLGHMLKSMLVIDAKSQNTSSTDKELIVGVQDEVPTC